MKKNKYGFVVLNYKNYYDTIQCVESILKLKYSDDYEVVIVDNSSPNNSCEVLQEKFKNNPKIKIVRSKRNGGYSSGNNLGIAELISTGIRKIIIATNDTEILSLNILQEFDRLTSRDVGIIGTSVLTPEGAQQNPPFYRPTFLYFLNLYLFNIMKQTRTAIYQILPLIERHRRSKVNDELMKLSANSPTVNQYSVYMLHGCFLYLTENYLEKVGMLDENLFMYGEEDLMAWNCELHGLKRLFLPSVKVLHKDGQSTKETHQEDKSKFVQAMQKKSNEYLVQKINPLKFIRLLLRYRGSR